MPTLEEALAAAFEPPAEIPAASEATSPATTAESPPADEAPEAEASSARPETDPETPEASPTESATPATPDAPPVDVEDLKAIKERIAADHPELQPVLTAALKEMERGLARKFEQVAALRKEAAEQIVSDERLKGIPREDLLQMAEWHRLAQANPQAAADHLFAASEQLRQQAQAPPQNPNPYAQLPPEVAQELEQMRAYYRTQTEHQLVQQIEGQFASLMPEFGGNAIPETQRTHVLETIQARNLGIEDIGMVWRGLGYATEYARQEALKKGQALRQQKAGLSAGSPAAAPPPATATQPKTLEDALEAVCTAHGLR